MKRLIKCAEFKEGVDCEFKIIGNINEGSIELLINENAEKRHQGSWYGRYYRNSDDNPNVIGFIQWKINNSVEDYLEIYVAYLEIHEEYRKNGGFELILSKFQEIVVKPVEEMSEGKEVVVHANFANKALQRYLKMMMKDIKLKEVTFKDKLKKSVEEGNESEIISNIKKLRTTISHEETYKVVKDVDDKLKSKIIMANSELLSFFVSDGFVPPDETLVFLLKEDPRILNYLAKRSNLTIKDSVYVEVLKEMPMFMYNIYDCRDIKITEEMAMTAIKGSPDCLKYIIWSEQKVSNDVLVQALMGDPTVITTIINNEYQVTDEMIDIITSAENIKNVMNSLLYNVSEVPMNIYISAVKNGWDYKNSYYANKVPDVIKQLCDKEITVDEMYSKQINENFAYKKNKRLMLKINN